LATTVPSNAFLALSDEKHMAGGHFSLLDYLDSEAGGLVMGAWAKEALLNTQNTAASCTKEEDIETNFRLGSR